MNNLIKEISQNFSIEKLNYFLSEKNAKYSENNEEYNYFEYNNLEKVVNIGNIKFDIDKLGVFYIEFNEDINYRTSKKNQYELGKEIIKEKYLDAGIFIFYSKTNNNFRFSYIYAEYFGSKRTFSHYKRYTFFVNPILKNKTFIEQISNCNFSSLEEIKKAFSVEPLTKQFYKELQNWYFYSLDKIKFPNSEKENEINLIRLITRIIFIWFMKEKELINPDLFDSEKLKEIIKDFNINNKSHNYYNAILQNLFFGTLNQEMNKRRFAKHGDFIIEKEEFGIKDTYRYKDKFKIDENEVLELFKNIPFLNGGLFECLDNDNIYIDGFSRNNNKIAIIPDYLFFQKEEISTDLSKYGLDRNTKLRGLIEILNSYNFTTNENTAIEEEVALDPELLGRIFENLLASYNPETKENARKSSGSFYTPKEIVNYMVDKSLFYYLKQKTSILEEEIIKLLSYSEEELNISDKEKKEITEILSDIKILDPACGSGAFPMGLLHKIVYILERIDENNKYWRESREEKALKETRVLLSNEEDKKEREEALKEINDDFDNSIKFPNYLRKLYLIENCIYGIDLQNIAIQISKLRFFISLVIEQDIDRSKDNFGINPLPNLETKFICANSLFKLEKENSMVSTIESLIKEEENELLNIRNKYFNPKNRNSKLIYKKKDKEIREKIKAKLLDSKLQDNIVDKISSYDIYDKNSIADWFDSKFMFGISGFDIIIGNPPYVSTKSISTEYANKLKEFYNFNDDLYNHFYFRGIELLNKNGILSYISSKTFWTIQTKKNLRELLLNNKLLEIIDSGNPFYESAEVDTCIAIVEKNSDISYKDNKVFFINPSKNNNDNNIIFFDSKNDKEKITYNTNRNIYIKDEQMFFNDNKIDNDISTEYYSIKQNIYLNTPNIVIFIPNSYNIRIYDKLLYKVNELIKNYWRSISTSKNIKEAEELTLKPHRETLKEGDITLLGLITEGGVGMQTGNNGKYIGVLENTKYAEDTKSKRIDKLLEFSKKNLDKNINFSNKEEVKLYLNKLSENEIRLLFDNLKEKYGRDIFGQGWLYRIVSKNEIANINDLSENEKLNGIKNNKTFVPYDKGDKEGNRWYAPTPYYIDWSFENVSFLKKNSGKKGQGMPVVRNPQFYFKEGFCWNNVLSDEKIKCRIKEKSIHSTEAMTFISTFEKKLPDRILVTLMNTKFFGKYRIDFINVSNHLTTGDAKELPIIIPNKEQLEKLEDFFNRAYSIQKRKFDNDIDKNSAKLELDKIQVELDNFVEKMYLG